MDYENYCQEKLMLYMPFRNTEQALLLGHQTWSATFHANQNQIANIEKIFIAQVGTKSRDIKQAVVKNSNENSPTIDLDNEFNKNIQKDVTDRYDIITNLKHYKTPKSIHDTRNSSHLEIVHPFLLSNDEYFKLRRQLN